MLKHLRTLSLRIAAVVVCSAPLQAIAQLGPPTEDIGSGELGAGDLKAAIAEVMKTVLDFVALIAVVMIVVAGIRYIISQGEEQEKEKAKKMIIYVVIGLLIILVARAIVTFVVSDVGGLSE